MTKFEQLRNKHHTFIYNSYEIGEDSFTFDFSIDDYHFRPSWSFDAEYLKKGHNSEFLNYLVFSLGMVELVSYWKCACPPEVIIKCGALNEKQIKWWKKLYFNGLGEFFFKNGIKTDTDSFMNISCVDDDVKKYDIEYEPVGSLIAIGGGKDSVVSIELLRPYMKDNLAYIINPRGATVKTAQTAGFDESSVVGVHRTIDKTLLALNAEGYLNGHTPFSSIVAFSSYIFAYLTKRKYIVLSNESSANESNIQGTQINHQYSKSTEFEADFRHYCKEYFSGKPEYFSLLRPWSEWQIAEKFVQFPQYFGVFQSCNVGSKTDVWCGKCAKCLYVYIMLAAFLPDETLVKIFGSDMLNNTEFEALFNGLVYADFDKPFECVGTKAEINLALFEAYKTRKENPPVLLKNYMSKNPENPASLDGFFDENNFVPQEFLLLLKL